MINKYFKIITNKYFLISVILPVSELHHRDEAGADWSDPPAAGQLTGGQGQGDGHGYHNLPATGNRNF